MKLTLLNLSDARREETLRQQAAEESTAKVSEALSPQLFQLGDPEDAKFQRITSPTTRRDLNPLMHERMQQVCFYLAVTTPFGKRIVEVITSYVVGEGFKAVAADPEVQAVIDRFWDDPINDFDRTLREYCEELCKFGEMCIPVAANPVDGFVRLGYVDPLDIGAIEYGTMQRPDGSDSTIRYPVAVHLKQRPFETTHTRLTIVRPDEDVNSPTYGRLVGECFYFSVNRAKGASRGISDLFCLADWIDVLDQMIFDFADKVRYLNSFVWDYTLTGADQKTLEEFKKSVVKAPPKQGGVQVHNEQVKIEARTPDFKGADMHESARMVKLYGLGGIGISPIFFADPIDANRSSAAEMEGPTGKKLTLRQNELKSMIAQMLQFVLDQALMHGVLAEGTDITFNLQVPDLLIKDLQKAATTMQGITGALTLAEDRGWVQAVTAARAFHVVLGQLGVEVDSQQEFELAQDAKQKNDAAQQDALNSQKNLADAMAKMKELNAGGEGVVQ